MLVTLSSSPWTSPNWQARNSGTRYCCDISVGFFYSLFHIFINPFNQENGSKRTQLLSIGRLLSRMGQTCGMENMQTGVHRQVANLTCKQPAKYNSIYYSSPR